MAPRKHRGSRAQDGSGRPGRPGRSAQPHNALSASELAVMLGDPKLASEAAVLSRDELQTIKQQTQGGLKQPRATNKDKRSKLSEKARMRRERILQMEAQRRERGTELSQTELEALEASNNLLSKAQHVREEQEDDVKKMNQMVLYAKCVAIRDEQVQEKKRAQEEEQQRNRKLDAEMEARRQQNIREVEEREQRRRQERKMGKAVIIQQMREREQMRLREREAKEQQAAASVAAMKLQAEQEIKDRREKAKAGRQLLNEILKANHEQAKAKMAKRQQELEQDQQIAAYIQEREVAEQLREEEAEKKRADKEREIAVLRSQQQKVADRQAELDALRAKRYQEAMDRKWRQKQRDEAEKRRLMYEELAKAREEQQKEKEQRLLAETLLAKQEFDKVLEWQRLQMEKEEEAKKAQKARRIAQRDEIKAQIQQREGSRKHDRSSFVEDGRRLVKQQQAERARLQRIKAAKLAELEASGVPEKYRTELARMQVLQANPFRQK